MATETELQTLKTAIHQASQLNSSNRSVLARLVLIAGWPEETCAMSPKLSELLGTAFDEAVPAAIY